MATPLGKIIRSIASVFVTNKKAVTRVNPAVPLKLYTFMLKGEGLRKSVNVKAEDKPSAEQKIHEQYPDCEAEFLWEMIKSSH